MSSAHPLSTANQDRFYALRDYDALRKLTDEEYANLEPITNDDLTPITSVDTVVPSDSKGWYLDLATPGEKVLAEARTFNNQIYFTTFVPNAGGAGDDPCTPAPAMNRLYVVSLFNAAPVTNLDTETTETGELTARDRYKEFPGTITSEVTFLFPSPDDPQECVGDECTPQPLACVDLFCVDTGFGNNPVRTFWSEKQIE